MDFRAFGQWFGRGQLRGFRARGVAHGETDIRVALRAEEQIVAIAVGDIFATGGGAEVVDALPGAGALPGDPGFNGEIGQHIEHVVREVDVARHGISTGGGAAGQGQLALAIKHGAFAFDRAIGGADRVFDGGGTHRITEAVAMDQLGGRGGDLDGLGGLLALEGARDGGGARVHGGDHTGGIHGEHAGIAGGEAGKRIHREVAAVGELGLEAGREAAADCVHIVGAIEADAAQRAGFGEFSAVEEVVRHFGVGQFARVHPH